MLTDFWLFQSRDYNYPTADIALLETSSTMAGTENTAIVGFAPNDEYQYVGDECWVAGWGKALFTLLHLIFIYLSFLCCFGTVRLPVFKIHKKYHLNNQCLFKSDTPIQ